MDHYILISAYPHSSQGWNHWSGESFSWMLEWCLHGNRKWKDFWMQTFISMELLFAGRLNVWEDFLTLFYRAGFMFFPLNVLSFWHVLRSVFYSLKSSSVFWKPWRNRDHTIFPTCPAFDWKTAFENRQRVFGGGKTPRLPMYRWGCNFSFRSLKSRFTQWCGIAVWILNL